VLHLFPGACNLLANDDTVYAVVTTAVGDGPHCAVVDVQRMDELVAIDARVSVERGCIHLGSLRVRTRDADIWNPRYRWEALQGESGRLSERLPWLTAVLASSAPDGSFADLLLGRDAGEGVHAETLIAAQEPAQDVIQGLLLVDVRRFQRGALGLAGLGAGLTPDGDDFLSGGLLAAWMAGGAARVQLIQEPAIRAAGRTGRLSATMLQAAAKGECGLRWHSLLDALQAGVELDVRRAAQEVVQIGHSSGASALAGFVAVARALTEAEQAAQ
jgi:hypothetical protein